MVSPVSSELYPSSSSEPLVLNETTSDSVYVCVIQCYECARDCGCRNENRAIYQVKVESNFSEPSVVQPICSSTKAFEEVQKAGKATSLVPRPSARPGTHCLRMRVNFRIPGTGPVPGRYEL